MFEEISHYRSNALNVSSSKLTKLLARYKALRKQEELKLKKRPKRQHLKQISKELNTKHRPEETYEIWHEFKHLNVGIESKLNVSEGPGENNTDEDDLIGEKLHNFTNLFDTSNHWTKTNFLITTNGLEVLPYENYNSVNSISRHHVKNLQTLLHLNVLRRNWQLAYKIFCLLVRTPAVDLRSIWPIGIEILRHCNQSGLKEEKFYTWLSSFYATRNSKPSVYSKLRKTSAPIWRSGSKLNTPLYVVSLLWSVLVKGKYSDLKDRLEELLLEPPYNLDGVFYFLLLLCYLIEAANMVDERMKIFIVQRVRTNLLKCDELNFLYPREIIAGQLDKVMGKEDVDEDISEQEQDDEDEYADVDRENAENEENGDIFDWGDISDDEDEDQVGSHDPESQEPDNQEKETQSQNNRNLENQDDDVEETHVEDAQLVEEDDENLGSQKSAPLEFDFDFD